MSKCDFKNVALQLDTNYTMAWVFSCKFIMYLKHLFIRTTLGK